MREKDPIESKRIFPRIPMFLLIIGAFSIFLFLPPEMRNRITHLFSKPTPMEELQKTHKTPPTLPDIPNLSEKTITLSPAQLQNLDAFSPEVATLDKELRDHSPISFSAKDVRIMAPLVAGRRLAAFGRVTSNEVSEAIDLFADFQMRIEQEVTEGSKNAVRNLRNKRIAEACRRLSLDDVKQALAPLLILEGTTTKI